MNQGSLKEQVRHFWNEQSCDTQVASADKFSREYFQQIEAFRYENQPFIHSFAQFPKYRGLRVLEVGFGAGTDFIQWLRVGALATGIDLTPEALENVTQRIKAYDLPQPQGVMVADAENLPFESNTFDLGYSYGVLHHSPDTPKAIGELVRVVKPGGDVKIMLYNRRSIFAYNQWIKHAALKGRPWKSPAWVLWHFMESVGTKAYTRAEIATLLAELPLHDIQVHTEITPGDYLSASAFWPLLKLNRLVLRLAGYSHNWESHTYTQRGQAPAHQRVQKAEQGPIFTGNPLGFYHCISARKAA